GISTIKGRFTDIRGQISDVPEDRTQASVQIEINAAALNSGQADRDTHLRSAMFLDTDIYPTITFHSTRIDVKEDNRIQVVGQLSCHGTTGEVVLDATVN